jgi:hypothetical protein
MAPLATAEELDTFTGGSFAAGQAALLLDAASAAVRGYCGWHIAPEQADTLTLDGVPERVLLLPTLLVTAVSAVTLDCAALDPATYQWSAGGRLYRAGGWGYRYRSVEVALTHGYAVTPDDVRSAVLSVAARHAVNPEGLKALTVGGIARTYANVGPSDAGVGLSPLEESVLARYRIQDRA